MTEYSQAPAPRQDGQATQAVSAAASLASIALDALTEAKLSPSQADAIEREISRRSGGVLTEEQIVQAAREYFRLHGRLPSRHATQEVPNHPDHSWAAINQAGQVGHRGLQLGRTLTKILAPLRAELGIRPTFTIDGVREAARQFFRQHGELPSAKTKGPVPGMPRTTWCAIHNAALQGVRGFKKPTTLPQILAPLKKELGVVQQLTEGMIRRAVREYHRLYGKFPSQLSEEPVPGIPNETWRTIDHAGWRGAKGLKKGTTLSSIVKPMRQNRLGSKNSQE